MSDAAAHELAQAIIGLGALAFMAFCAWIFYKLASGD